MRSSVRMSILGWACILVGFAVLFRALPAHANTTTILPAWQTKYGSQAPSYSNAHCALCHTAKLDQDVNNNTLWNSYGNAIRACLHPTPLPNPPPTPASCLATTEGANSDGDAAGKTNLQEINAGAQPGWTAGPNNATYNSTGVLQSHIPAPSGIGDLDPTVCTLSASNTSPTAGTSITLTASCSNSPTSYTWSDGAAGCSSTSATCMAMAAGAGPVTYTVKATTSGGTSGPVSVIVNWQPPLVGAPACTLSASSTSPTAGTTITLTASCSPNPTSYTWTGCSSNTASCMATAASPGPVTYSVKGTNSGGTGAPASVTVNWQPPGSGVNLNQHGLTGSWYKPSTSGQGAEIEIYKDLIAPGTGLLQGAWFTYDYTAAGGAASQRWYTFSGNVTTGQSSATFTIYQNVGGNFNALPVTSAVPVGSVVFSVTDCTHATMAYTFTDGSGRSGTIALVRLLPNVTCSTSSASATNADFGYSGNWYVSATSGQGIVLELNPNQPFVFFAWYTYAPNGQSQGAAGQRWYTGQANYTPGARTLPMTLFETTGGLFDSAMPTPNTVPVGTATATFTSCNALRLSFAFSGGSSAGASGTINFTRVGPTPAGCGP